MRKKLSDAENQYIKNNYLIYSYDEIAKHLNINKRRVSYLVEILNLEKRPLKKWSNKEILFLKENYQKSTIDKICFELNRSKDSVFQKISELGILKKNKLTKDMLHEEYIVNKQTVLQIAEKYNKTKCRIYSLLRKFNIKLEKRDRIYGKNHKQWTGYMEISGTYWCQIKGSAKDRNICIAITIEDIWNKFIEQNRKCALSGVELTFGEGSDKYKNTTASLDRINSSKGYTIDNIQWVHKQINTMKMNLDQDIFIDWCNLISKNNKKEK